MNKLQAATKIAETVNQEIKKTFLGFDEDTLRLISADEFFCSVYENTDGTFIRFQDREVIHFDGFVPAGFNVEAYYSDTLEVYKS